MFFLFDLDGTLTDSNGIWLEVDLEFARRRGLTVTQKYTDFVAHSIFTTAADFTRDYYHLEETPEAIMEEWLELAYEAYARCEAKPGVLEFLAACREQQIPMAIVTASMPSLTQAALRQLGILDWFQFFLYAQDLGLEKRDPRVWEHAARLAGCPPENCVVFDDSPVACAAARQIGMRDVGMFDSLHGAAKEEMQRNCRHYLVDFSGHCPEEFLSDTNN